MQLTTDRLRLVAMTPALSRVESDATQLGRQLRAAIPAAWPPREMRTALGCRTATLIAQPELSGWVNWYWLLAAPAEDVLVGYGGFKGLPDEHGVIEIGYAVVAPYRRQGYATEAVGALVRWAWTDPRVSRIDAETRASIQPSVRLLARLGFRRLPQTDPEILRYALDRARA